MFLGCRLGYDSLHLSIQHTTDQDRTYIKKVLQSIADGNSFYGAEYTKHFPDDWSIACTHGLLKREVKLRYTEAYGVSNINATLPDHDLNWLFYKTCVEPSPQFESHALFDFKSLLGGHPNLKALMGNMASDKA